MSKEKDNSVGSLTPEEVADAMALKESVSLDFTSKEDSGGTQFKPLEPDTFYKFTVDAVEVRERPQYDNPSATEKVIMITFTVDENLTGTDIYDIDGIKQEPGVRKYWEFLSTTALGFTSGGEPSKTRMCICALLGKDVEDDFALNDLDELLDKSCKAMLSLVKKQDGSPKNKVLKYSSIK